MNLLATLAAFLGLAISCNAQLVTQAQFACAARTKGGTAASYSSFRNSLQRAQITTKEEASKYLAHSCWETEGWKYTKEQLCQRDLERCRRAYPNNKGGLPGKVYYGRGMLQLTWDYNYRDAGAALGKNLLANPEQVADDPQIAWSSAAWFWSSRVHSTASTFGNTLKAINSIECDGGENSFNRIPRFNHYKEVLKCMGIAAPPDSDGYCRWTG